MHKDLLWIALGSAIAMLLKGVIAGFLNPILGMAGVTYS
jgi:hypothetical protein